MLSERDYYLQSLRDHLYYLRTIRYFCITIELSFYKNNVEYIEISQDFANKCDELGRDAISLTKGLVSQEALAKEIYVSKYSLPCELLTEKLFGINIDTVITEKELSFQAGQNENIDMPKIQELNQKAYVFAQNFKAFCREINEKLDNNTLFSFSYSDFFNYLFNEVDSYILDLERIIAMEGYSPIYAVGYEYKFGITLQKTARFIRDWVDVSKEEIFDLATYYVNSFGEIIDTYLKASISPDVQEELSNKMKLLLTDYQDFLKSILKHLINQELYFITPPIAIDNIYTSVNFYKFILEQQEEEVS